MNLTKRLAIAALCAAALTAPAWARNVIIDVPPPASGCPADHPHKRMVDGGLITCTLMACMGKLVCPADGGTCIRLPAGDCNTCTHYISIMICLSDNELRDAGGKP